MTWASYFFRAVWIAGMCYGYFRDDFLFVVMCGVCLIVSTLDDLREANR